MVKKREQALGWVLAGAMLIHLLILQPQAEAMGALIMVLLIGVVLRKGQVYLPRWLGRASLLIGLAAVFLGNGGFRPSLLGELAAAAGALFLLREVTPARGLRVLFCLLIMLVASILKWTPSVGETFLIVDVAVLFLLAEQIYRPPEAVVSFWLSIARSLRVIVPVGIVVTAVFWFFPNLSVYTPQLSVGFSGSETMNPGGISGIAQSYRVAMTARFPQNQPLPAAKDLYWRGQVLEYNDGLKWSAVSLDKGREDILRDTPPQPGVNVFRYSQELEINRSGVVPVLDHAVFIDAQSAGQDVVMIENGASVLSAVAVGALKADVASTTTRLSDAPQPNIAEGSTNVPKRIKSDPRLQEITERIYRPGMSTSGKMDELRSYFGKSGFRYSMRPGGSDDLGEFLTKKRKGFCEHYAAAAANLLRLGGVPCRIVTGYRGGTWNPWLRSITVRDANAHAWIEVWDEQAREWQRFDPTDFVAPDLSIWIEREMDSTHWPWYRTAWSLLGAIAIEAARGGERIWTSITSSAAWENADVILFAILVAVALYWLIRNFLARRARSSQEMAERLLRDLEAQAARLNRERKAGETPLAWLGRLEAAAEAPEKEALRELAIAYEDDVYKPGKPGVDPAAGLQPGIRRVMQIWKKRRA